MRITTILSCAALAAVMATAAIPAPGAAQIGERIKKAVKQQAAQTAVDRAAEAVGARPADQATGVTGPRFTETTLEMTPEVLDRFERGLAAEQAVRQDIDRLTGKVLSPETYRACSDSVRMSPEGMEILLQAADLIPENASDEQLRKATEELSRRLDRIIEPRCGMAPMKAAEVRGQHAGRLTAAAPAASGLTELQLYHMKERIVPFCTALETLSMGAGEARVPTEARDIFWVYSAVEVESLRPRCGGLMSSLRPGA